MERDDDGKYHRQDYVPILDELATDNIIGSSKAVQGVEGGGRCGDRLRSGHFMV